MGGISQVKCPPQQAWELLQELDTRHQDLLSQQQQCLTAAAMFHDDPVAQAAKVGTTCCPKEAYLYCKHSMLNVHVWILYAC